MTALTLAKAKAIKNLESGINAHDCIVMHYTYINIV